jgi:hypothetical protein
LEPEALMARRYTKGGCYYRTATDKTKIKQILQNHGVRLVVLKKNNKKKKNTIYYCIPY